MMNQAKRRRLALFVIGLILIQSGCRILTEPPKVDRQKTSTADTRCGKCHESFSPSDMDTLSMHKTHFRALGQNTACDLCHVLDKAGTDVEASVQSGVTVHFSQSDADRMTPYYASWATSDLLDARHAENEVDCAGCHGNPSPQKRPSMKQCLDCHGSYDQVAELTADIDYNPHASHYGELRCSLCHKGHEPFVLYCNQCHDFEVPAGELVTN